MILDVQVMIKVMIMKILTLNDFKVSLITSLVVTCNSGSYILQ